MNTIPKDHKWKAPPSYGGFVRGCRCQAENPGDPPGCRDERNRYQREYEQARRAKLRRLEASARDDNVPLERRTT